MNLKVFNNVKWIILCKLVQSILALIISMLTARYLGPSNFGIINYAASLVSFVAPIMFLGINNIIVNEIIQNPDNEGEVLGTSVVLCIISGIFCIFGVTFFAQVANPNEPTTVIVCLLYSLLLIFQATELLQYWFQSKLLSKYTSIIMLIAYFIVSVYKFILLVLGKSVYWFAISNAFDYMLISFGMFIVYKKLGGLPLTFSLKRAKKLFNKGKYYIVSSMMVTIFSQTDKIMIKAMIDETAVGYYSAAIACCGITTFVFAAIIDSMRPLILSLKTNDDCEYKLNLTRLYSIVIYLALGQSVVFTLLSKYIILILYGKAYFEAISTLKIAVWYTTFSYIGAVRNVWILAEEKQQYLWIINLSGALMNIVLNAFLIPVCGINGAAIASLITQIFTNIIVGYIIPPIRYNNKLMLRSLNPKYMIKMFDNIRKKQ